MLTSTFSTCRVLTLAIAALLPLAAPSAVQAQAMDRYEQRRAKQEQKKQEAAAPAEEKFPAATRTSPKAKASSKGGKALNAIVALYEAQKYPEAIQKVEALAADTSSSAFEKGFAYQLAASAAADSGDHAKAAAYFSKALDTEGLANNEHYQVMYNLAVTHYGAERYSEALALLDRFLAETKAEKPEYLSLKASTLGNLDRGAEAAALYEQMLTRNPSDKKALMNAVALHQQSDNYARANALLLDAQKKGLLTEAKEYRALYVGFINEGKLKEAIAAIDDGVAKGVIQPSPELANDYSAIASNAYVAENVAMSLEMYKRAAPMAKDGEPALNLAKVLLNEGRIAEAKQAARQALDKGVRKPEDARKILAQGGK